MNLQRAGQKRRLSASRFSLRFLVWLASWETKGIPVGCGVALLQILDPGQMNEQTKELQSTHRQAGPQPNGGTLPMMRNVIVTGGSRGIGLGIAQQLAAAGFRAIAIARSQSSEFSSLLDKVQQAQTGALGFVPFDLAKIEDIPGMVKDLIKQFGPIHGLVNNAGMSADGALAMMPTSHIEQVVRLNTLSPMVLTKHAVRSMMASGDGRIVNISSITAFSGYSGLSVYSATKASLVGFTRSLAREVGRMGVTVNAVAPGFVATEMTAAMKDEDRDRIVRRSSLRRLVEVGDVANAVAFLMSDQAKNITGTVVTVDAGSTA